jgi:PIN domain nuclease of toxin-antitoxin system
VSHVIIDTHVLAWSFIAPSILTPEVRRILESGMTVHVPPCSLHEIALKVRKGKWDEMAPYASRLDSMCAAQGFRIAPYTGRMAILAGSMEWGHVDPFDRMIAATAIEMACPLISTDKAFDDLETSSEWKGRIWDIAPDDPEP